MAGNRVKLRKRFADFVFAHVDERFFTEEAAHVHRAVRRSELRRALLNAYDTRSRFVHQLQPIHDCIRTPGLADGDFCHWRNNPLLTFAGLARITRKTIAGFIDAQPRTEREDIDWRRELPGLVSIQLAPQYWIARHRGFRPTDADVKLSGFLEQLETFFLTGQPITGIQNLMAKYEQVLGQAERAQQASMLALYYLFNSRVGESERRPDWEDYCHNGDVFNQCCMPMMAVHLVRDIVWPWSAEHCVETWNAYERARYRPKGLRLPPILELAVILAIANKHREQGNEAEYRNWCKAAILDAAGEAVVQALIDKRIEKPPPLSYHQLISVLKKQRARRKQNARR